MTSTAKTAAATDLDLSALVEGEPANSTDVSVPFTEAEDAIDGARTTLSVTANDTHVKNLDDALTVSAPLTKTVTAPGGDEKINLALNAAALSLDAGQIDTGTVDRARLPAFVGTDGISPGEPGVVPAPTEFDGGKFLRADNTWQAVAGSGTVTSVAVAPPSDLFTVTGSPIEAAGTITFVKVSQPAARVYATPASTAGTPALIALESAHIPVIPSSKLSDRGMTRIGSYTALTVNASSITINSIPSTYAHLVLRIRVRTTNTSIADSLLMQFNGNSGNYYAFVSRTAHSAAVGTAEVLNTSSALQFNSSITGDTAPASLYTFLTFEIFDYASTTQYKFVNMYGTRVSGNTTGTIYSVSGGGYWGNSAAITSIVLTPLNGVFVSSSGYQLFGEG